MINVNEVDIKKLTLKELVKDAQDRKNKKALAYLKEQSHKIVKRKVKDKNGVEKEIEVIQPITCYRKQYLVLFCGWVEKLKEKSAEEKERIKQMKRKKDAEARYKMFEEAEAAIDAALAAEVDK